MKMPLGKPPIFNSTEAIITNKLQSLLDTSAFSPPPKPTRINATNNNNNNNTNLSLDNLADNKKTNTFIKSTNQQHIIVNNYETQHDSVEHLPKNQYSPTKNNNNKTTALYKRSPSVGNSKSDFKYFSKNVII